MAGRYRLPITGEASFGSFWASWEGRSRAETFRVRRMLKGNQGKIEAVSISLDVNDAARKGIERMDSVSWTSYCDFQS